MTATNSSIRLDHHLSLPSPFQICFDVAGKAQTLKKNLRTFRGFAFKADSADYTKKCEGVQKLDAKVLKAICDILDVEKKGTNKDLAERICEFLLSPEGEPEPPSDEDGEEEEEEEEEEPKPTKKAPAKRGGGRPRRSTAGKSFNHEDFLSSEESEEEEAKPKGKRKRGDTDSGSDYNPSGASDSEGGARKVRATGTRRSARYQSNSEEEEDDDFATSEEDSDPPPNRNKRGATRRPAARGRKKKESESEEEDESEESDVSDAPKTKPAKRGGKTTAASPTKGRGRPKRVATTKKKARDQTSSEEEDVEEEVDEELMHFQDEASEDEPLAKKPKSGDFPSVSKSGGGGDGVG